MEFSSSVVVLDTVLDRMELSQDRKFPLSTMQRTLRLSQDAGYLHTLTVAARIDNRGYSSEVQASLEELIIRLHSDLRKMLEPFSWSSRPKTKCEDRF